MSKSLLFLSVGAVVGAALGVVFNDVFVFIVCAGVGAGVGFALGTALTSRGNGPRYFILFRKERNVVAAEVLPPATGDWRDDWPSSLSIQGTEYLPLEDEDMFLFWDELRDTAGATVGYIFFMLESPTFLASSLLRHSGNVCMDGEDVEILLEPCSNPKTECVQGFGSVLYVNKDDKTDCVLYMYDWSENPVAFPLCPVA